MAHHVFRRCLLADVVPPVPTIESDYRLVVSNDMSWLLYIGGRDIGAEATDVGTLLAYYVQPIPPGMDTGLGYYRAEVGATRPIEPLTGVDVQGSPSSGGTYI